MAYIGWKFPPLSSGPKQGYTNSGIETFKGENLMDNLAREVCQNSLDAKSKECDLPVTVKFELRKYDVSCFSVFSEYRRYLENCKRYWGDDADKKLKRFFSGADNCLENGEIDVLVISDYNTTGLNGSCSEKNNTAWTALTGADGICVKPGDTSGGSYGIGKNAPFACSSLSTVFYNTFAEDGKKAFRGVARMATTLDLNNKPTQGIGHYQNNDDENEKWLPIFEQDKCDFRDEFLRSEHGTDIIILGFNAVKNWKEMIEKAIGKNFFLAVYEKKLVVEIENERIDSDNIYQIIEKYSGEKAMETASQLFEAVAAPDAKKYISILEENDAIVYVKSKPNYSRTIANFRTSGMLVGQYSRRVLQHYAAVLQIVGVKLDDLLKDTEPATHRRWDSKLIENDPLKRKMARDAIDQLEYEVLELIRTQYENVSETVIDSDTAEYIADDFDDFGQQIPGDDIMRAKQSLAKIRVKDDSVSIEKYDAKIGTGESAQQGDVNNDEQNIDIDPIDEITTPVTEGNGDEEGAVRGRGSKNVTLINASVQKITPINISGGLYQLIVKADEDYNNAVARVAAIGEDGNSDILDIEYAVIDSVRVETSDSKIGPFSLKSGEVKKITVCLSEKERMLLNLIISGEESV